MRPRLLGDRPLPPMMFFNLGQARYIGPFRRSAPGIPLKAPRAPMTYATVHCPCCLATDLAAREAIVSPFISDYVLGGAARPSVLLQCRDCDALFYRDRFTSEEVDRLYADYRGERYFRTRRRFEPWYTRRHNERFGQAKEMGARQNVYRSAVAAARTGPIDTVLDYGGDNGQLMVGGPGTRHHVYDISGIEPVHGVAPISTAADLRGRTFDLVLLCHVVEHFSEPLAGVKDVAAYVRSRGLMFVEVPFERFPFGDIPQGRWYRRYLDALRASPGALRLLDFWSTGWRVKFGRIPPLGFVKLHEHLNYFDVRSLRALLGAAGLEVLSCEVSPTTRAVYAVCRRPS